MRPLFQSKITSVELNGIEFQLDRIATALESLIEKPSIVPEQDFNPDDFSSISYSDEVEELVQQHLDNRILVGF